MSIAQQTQPARPLADIVTDLRDVSGHATKVLTDVHADADEKIHALKVTAARLAEDLAEARQAALDEQRRAHAFEAAGIALVADNIRREEALEAQLRRERAENASQQRINLALQGHLDDAGCENRRLSEHVARLANKCSELEQQRDREQQNRFRLRHGR